jgi:hypothetical protein
MILLVESNYLLQEQDPERRPAKRPKRTRKIKSTAIVADEHLSPGPELPTTNLVTPPTVEWSEEDKSRWTSL